VSSTVQCACGVLLCCGWPAHRHLMLPPVIACCLLPVQAMEAVEALLAGFTSRPPPGTFPYKAARAAFNLDGGGSSLRAAAAGFGAAGAAGVPGLPILLTPAEPSATWDFTDMPNTSLPATGAPACVRACVRAFI
jgi:hypothetical protein